MSSYHISEAVSDASERLKALKKIKKKWPDAYVRSYGNTKYILWIVDMDIEECTSFLITDEGAAIIFKNIANGINIAPGRHHIKADMLQYYIKENSEAFTQIKNVFAENAYNDE